MFLILEIFIVFIKFSSVMMFGFEHLARVRKWLPHLKCRCPLVKDGTVRIYEYSTFHIHGSVCNLVSFYVTKVYLVR